MNHLFDTPLNSLQAEVAIFFLLTFAAVFLVPKICRNAFDIRKQDKEIIHILIDKLQIQENLLISAVKDVTASLAKTSECIYVIEKELFRELSRLHDKLDEDTLAILERIDSLRDEEVVV